MNLGCICGGAGVLSLMLAILSLLCYRKVKKNPEKKVWSA